MYENGQGHLTLFCIVFVWLRGRPSAVRSPIQDPWFMYQNRLGPSGRFTIRISCLALFIISSIGWGLVEHWLRLSLALTQHCPSMNQCNCLTYLFIHFRLKVQKTASDLIFKFGRRRKSSSATYMRRYATKQLTRGIKSFLVLILIKKDVLNILTNDN